jgi:2-methylisocitrate lyase-like PEP mutase family enzyme
LNAASNRRDTFRALHADGLFIIPNPFDIGSARILEHLGFPALATTSSGFAATLGRNDQHTYRNELVEHVRAICASVDIPVNVDAEGCFAHEEGGVARTVTMLAEAGAAGVSIEDFDPTVGGILPVGEAADRVSQAVNAARPHQLVVTARAEAALYGSTDLDDLIARLAAYRDAGADVLYAPGVRSAHDIERVVAVGLPVNVLAMPGVPPTAELRSLGVRRVSTGGSLAWAAYGGLARAATELRDHGTYGFLGDVLDRPTRAGSFR